MTPEEIGARLEAFIARSLGAREVRVADLRLLTGGASRETWSLDATVEHTDGRSETVPLILQRDARGAPKSMSRALEYRLIGAAHAAGVPAPEPFLFGDDSLRDARTGADAKTGARPGEFFLVRRIDGETLPKRLLRDGAYAEARAALPGQLGRILARIHAIPVTQPALDGLPEPTAGVSASAAELQKYEAVFRAIAPEPHPAFELAFRWLGAALREQTAESRERSEKRVLVHGDFRMGNVLFGPDGARAILDWELAHAGDPMEDLGWICVRSWRFGGDRPVGGIGTREELFAAYEAGGGAQVDPERVRWWEVFGNLRWGIICISQAKTYLDGLSNSVELASIGRRTAETEWELLNLIE